VIPCGGNNPLVPDWLRESYLKAIRDLAELGTQELWRSDDPVLIQSALGAVALARGLRVQAQVLLSYTEDELAEMVPE
jgi:hypothetical protein